MKTLFLFCIDNGCRRKLRPENVMNFLLHTFIFDPEQALEVPEDLILTHTKCLPGPE